MAGEGEQDPGERKGLEGTRELSLPANRHCHIRSASSDQQLKEILDEIKTSKTPVRGYQLWRLMGESIASKLLNCEAVDDVFSVCRVCSQILPPFCELSNKFKKLSFVYADIDECPETTQHIRYTPTFQFFRDGEKVDEMFGGGEQRLHDRLWLHS